MTGATRCLLPTHSGLLHIRPGGFSPNGGGERDGILVISFLICCIASPYGHAELAKALDVKARLEALFADEKVA